MRTRNNNIIRSIAFLLLALSCEKETSWDIQSSDSVVVADCIITNEMKTQELRLYYSDSRLNDSLHGISGAVIELNNGIDSISFIEKDDEPGRYLSTIPFMASAGITYRLVINCNAKYDTAYAEMTGVTPLDAIDIVARDSFFRVVYHKSQQASMTEVYYDWSMDGVYCTRYGACQAAEVFYTLDNIDISKEFAPDRQIISFPSHTLIIRRKYSLNQDHQRFIRSLLLETEWRGGLFDVEQGNVPTNFNYGMHGWFAACAVLTDTTRFE